VDVDFDRAFTQAQLARNKLIGVTTTNQNRNFLFAPVNPTGFSTTGMMHAAPDIQPRSASLVPHIIYPDELTRGERPLVIQPKIGRVVAIKILHWSTTVPYGWETRK